MSDEESQKGHPSRSKVKRLPTDVAEMVDNVRRTLRLADQQSEDCSRISESDTQTRSNSVIVEALIGLGLMLVGLSLLVVVSLLPAKAGSWLFIVAALVALLGGAMKIDRATRQHRMSRQSGSSSHIRRSVGDKTSVRPSDRP